MRATALVLALAGCIDDGAIVDSPSSDELAALSAERAVAGDDATDVCALLPDCGACSLACAPEQLVEQYVPDGTCAVFACELTDGRLLHVSVCNPPG
jgi:hypothetical protein